MKHININSGLMLVSLIVSLFLSGCTEKTDYMEPGIVDMNNRITSIDKQVAQPGDIVTVTGTDLDKVFKVLLNTDNVPVQFTATATQLQLTIPATSPLGDVITLNFLFSGKGLASRAIKIISPPVIIAMSPEAGRPDATITVYGKELHLSKIIKIGGVDVTSTMVLESDKIFTVKLPAGFTGGDLTIETEAGGISTSPYPLVLGVEYLVTDYDKSGSVFNYGSAYGNSSGKDGAEAFPKNKIYVVTIEDKSTSWGGNYDLYLKSMPDIVNVELITMVIDAKASKQLTINFMVGVYHNPPGLWGKKMTVTTSWQTIRVPFSQIGQGYDNIIPIPADDPIVFKSLAHIKLSLPAKTSDNLFGETISFDNVKFIVRDQQ